MVENEDRDADKFRPEKEQSKQIYALAKLFTDHPEYREGEKRVTLTLMGGTRDEKDQARAAELRQLASKLEISVCSLSLLDPMRKRLEKQELMFVIGQCQLPGERTMGGDCCETGRSKYRTKHDAG